MWKINEWRERIKIRIRKRERKKKPHEKYIEGPMVF